MLKFLLCQLHGYTSHLPLILDQKENNLLGHLAKANPHVKALDDGVETLCIFHGPHGYISPSWYVSPSNVPTWNYAVVHVLGKAKASHDPNEIERILDITVKKHEAQFEKPWQYLAGQKEATPLLNAIVGFEIKISSIEGKFKMSQNRSKEDQAAALKGVQQFYGKLNPDLVQFMKRELDE